MAHLSLLSAAFLLLQSVASAKHVVVESLPKTPAGWNRVRDADPGQHIQLRIALEQPNLAVFEKTLYDVSSPQNPLYGRHLSREEVRDLVKPTEESTSAVLEWLESAGTPSANIEDAGDWINFNTTVAKAEILLNADFGIYNHVGTTTERLRTLSYSVPADVKSHITLIQPTTRFGQMKAQADQVFEVIETGDAAVNSLKVAADVPGTELDASCNSTVTPECLRALYKIGNYRADPSVDSILGISGFLEQYAKHDALDSFLEKFAPYALAQNFTTVLVNGGIDNQIDTVDSDVEANLDIQYAASLGFETNVRYYSTGGRGILVPDLEYVSNEPYLEFVTYLTNLADEELPATLTTSYGENEQSVPKTYAEKVCQMFGQLGARGVSVIFSSGDTGPGSACQTNDGTNRTRLLPIFPGACPYVTSVGGTVGVQPERAVSFSSGGFSDVFPRPEYQDAVVSAYVESIGTTFAGLYNPDGRGFPDVATQGRGFQVITQGRTISVGGTSASAPTFAGIVSLLNNARIRDGQPALGFLNPWLYNDASSGFTDIVDGGSQGCSGRDIYSGLPTPYVPGAGWNATEGWDPVTGLGTPLFDKLLAISGGSLLTIGS
ncbi:peptidase S8/S53 domain-containing protein [Pseudomassariella vexata]|uniref:tripeptidyl-peptidase II n=1 Tax=Pseudomassariella vexata TaxID=1141098 RepID=A0A1Y2EBD5_9PEZI|nr:peptidase S8/S53 domain-containing protein [Pseudomassariella vexata]ORY68727.1 peptidase S8/S53 domain-containing protein [Pseudomassariella vexata]